jgi:hypothetical protein
LSTVARSEKVEAAPWQWRALGTMLAPYVGTQARSRQKMELGAVPITVYALVVPILQLDYTDPAVLLAGAIAFGGAFVAAVAIRRDRRI